MDLMIFKTIKYDRQRLDGRSAIPFFASSDDDDESVTTNSEESILKWLLADRGIANFFIGSFFQDLSNLRGYLRLTEPFVTKNQKPGDIDLLLVDSTQPHKAISFEVKKVKALAINDEVSKINGAEKVAKGVIQVNKYQSIGFHQTYYLLIILNDGRIKTTPNVMLRNADSMDVRRVYSIPWNEPLHPDIGIAFIDVNQFTGRHINQTGSIGLCIDKYASQLGQTHELTRKVTRLLNDSSKLYVNFS